MRQETPRKSRGTVSIAPGFKLWREVVCSVRDYHGMDVDVTVSWSDEHARLVATRIEVAQLAGGEPLTSESLRKVAVQSFLRRSLVASIRDGLTPEGAADTAPRRAFGLITDEQALECKANGPTAGTLRWVATVYRAALAVGDGPTKAIRETFEVSQSTAGAWVSAARKAGLLGAADGPGRAGA